MKFTYLIIFIISVTYHQVSGLVRQRRQDSSISESNFEEYDSDGCVTDSYCSTLKLECDCPVGQECIRQDRTCFKCPELLCRAFRKTRAEQDRDIAVIAVSSIGSVVLVALAGAIGFYFWNRKEIERHGGITTYVRYRANRDSIIMMTGDEDVELLNKRLSILSLTSENQRSSVLLPTQKHHLDTLKQKPKVFNLSQSYDEDSGLSDLFDNGTQLEYGNTVFEVAEKKPTSAASADFEPKLHRGSGTLKSEVLMADPTHLGESFEEDVYPSETNPHNDLNRRLSSATFNTVIMENPILRNPQDTSNFNTKKGN